MALAPGDLIAGKYRIERLLGQGGMGAVYVALNERLQKPVALKVLNEALVKIPGAADRFIREAIAAARAKHPGVVETYDADVHEGLPWIAMELLEGETLGQRLSRGPLPLDRALAVASQAAAVLAAVHDVGIIHRDLKPDNLFIERLPKAQERVKVLDFGVAKVAVEGLDRMTRTGITMGTPEYLAPEQATGAKNVDARADVYALGVILYQSLTGELPYQADTFGGLVAKMITEGPRPLASIAPHLPGPITALVDRCIAVDPNRRPESMHELARELDALSGSGLARTQPVPVASAPPPAYRAASGSGVRESANHPAASAPVAAAVGAAGPSHPYAATAAGFPVASTPGAAPSMRTAPGAAVARPPSGGPAHEPVQPWASGVGLSGEASGSMPAGAWAASAPPSMPAAGHDGRASGPMSPASGAAWDGRPDVMAPGASWDGRASGPMAPTPLPDGSMPGSAYHPASAPPRITPAPRKKRSGIALLLFAAFAIGVGVVGGLAFVLNRDRPTVAAGPEPTAGPTAPAAVPVEPTATASDPTTTGPTAPADPVPVAPADGEATEPSPAAMTEPRDRGRPTTPADNAEDEDAESDENKPPDFDEPSATAMTEAPSTPAPPSTPTRPPQGTRPQPPANPPATNPPADRPSPNVATMPQTPPAPTPGPAVNDRSLPAQPTPDQVRFAFQSLRRRVRECARGTLGAAQATVTVDGPTGRVVDARVNYHNPSAGSCMAQALRGAYFPRARTRYVANHSYRIGIFR